MKKLLIASLLLFSGVAFAQHRIHHHHHSHWRYVPNYGWSWVAPAVVGGVVVYQMTRPPVVVQQPPAPPIIVEPQNCGPWTETKNADGTVTISRTCQQ